MVKRQLKVCAIVSLVMALVLPIVSVEIYVAANDIEQRPDQAAYADALESGATPEEAAAVSLRKITGIERITHRFEDWYSFRDYAWQVLYYLSILLVATLLVSGFRLYDNRAT